MNISTRTKNGSDWSAMRVVENVFDQKDYATENTYTVKIILKSDVGNVSYHAFSRKMQKVLQN